MLLEPDSSEGKEIIEKNTRFIKEGDFQKIGQISKELATEDSRVECIEVRAGYCLVKVYRSREQIPIGSLAVSNKETSDHDLTYTSNGTELISSIKSFKRLGIKAEDGKIFLFWARVK